MGTFPLLSVSTFRPTESFMEAPTIDAPTADHIGTIVAAIELGQERRQVPLRSAISIRCHAQPRGRRSRRPARKLIEKTWRRRVGSVPRVASSDEAGSNGYTGCWAPPRF